MSTSFLYHAFGLPGYDYVRQEFVGGNVLLHVRPKGKLVRCMVLFAIDVATRKVEILGLHAQPNGPWMEQIARKVSGEGGFFAGKKYLIHDRDPLYTDKCDSILKAAGVQVVKLPPRSLRYSQFPDQLLNSLRWYSVVVASSFFLLLFLSC